MSSKYPENTWLFFLGIGLVLAIFLLFQGISSTVALLLGVIASLVCGFCAHLMTEWEKIRELEKKMKSHRQMIEDMQDDIEDLRNTENYSETSDC